MSASWTAADPVAEEAWNRTVAGIISRVIGAKYPTRSGGEVPLYDPVREGLEHLAADPIAWPAFPGPIDRDEALSAEVKLTEASKRANQVEYCEWHSRLDADGRLLSVTFTTEVPEYYEALWEADPEAVVGEYRSATGDESITAADLRDANGGYDRSNPHLSAGAVHLMTAPPNTLGAAVDLVADALIVRLDSAGAPVQDKDALMRCAGRGLGDRERGSDPQIASIVHGLAIEGARVGLADPIGPFIAELRTERFQVLDEGLEISRFWRPDREVGGRVVRATFGAPGGQSPLEELILFEDQPLTSGAQLAKRVNVAIAPLVIANAITPQSKPC